MANKSSRPSENKVHTPKAAGKISQGSKDRKGGKKSRKLEPERRLRETLGKFISASGTMTTDKKREAEKIKRHVAAGVLAPLSKKEFEERVDRKQRPLDPRKVARLLMPNARW